MTTIAEYWRARADFFRVERRASLAMYRQTKDKAWRAQAISELERELEAEANYASERDLELQLFRSSPN